MDVHAADREGIARADSLQTEHLNHFDVVGELPRLL
jgi:hypothetical protein